MIEESKIPVYCPPTMEEVAKSFPAYGGIYAFVDGDARENLERYIQECINLVEDARERVCLKNIWETEKGIISGKGIEGLLRTHKIFCDGKGKMLQKEVVEKFIKSQPSESLRKSYTQLWEVYKKENNID